MARTQYKAECALIARETRRRMVHDAGEVGCHNYRVRTISHHAGNQYIRIPLSHRAEGYGGKLRRSQWGYLLSRLDFTDPWVDNVILRPRKERAYWRAKAAYAESFKDPESFLLADVEAAERAFTEARAIASRLVPYDEDHALADIYLSNLAIYRVCESRWVVDGAVVLMTKAAETMLEVVQKAAEDQTSRLAEQHVCSQGCPISVYIPA